MDMAIHDHQACVAHAVAAAERVCERHGARLTELRRRVLELVWTRHQPITAYELLDLLKADHRSAAPPTVYRALEFLLEQGLIHRIEALNAFIGCPDPERLHRGGCFLICNRCRSVEEIRDNAPLREAIRTAAASRGFAASSSMIEMQGLCRECSGGGSA